ncbi:MAG: sulfatase [Chloroflexota bacterium]
MNRHATRIAALVALAAMLLPMIGAIGLGSPAQAGPTRPNFIIIQTDDQDVASIRYLPSVKAMAREGVTFRNFFVTTPICCPSRVSMLSGQYAHNHRVLYNSAPGGGFPEFRKRPVERSNLAVWMQDAGYRTGFFGKFLNGYPQGAGPAWVGSGWTEWSALLSGHYFDFVLNVNGAKVMYPDARDNSTIAIGARAGAMIRSTARSGEPFFVVISPQASHTPLYSEERYRGIFGGVTAPRTPDYAEADTRDKPEWVRQWGMMTYERGVAIDANYRDRLETLMSVDAMLANLRRTLQATGQAGNTWIFFTSDNGWLAGAHNAEGKQSAYDASAKVPMVVFGPGAPRGRTIPELAQTIDIAPTVLNLAGLPIPRTVDGRSLAPFLRGEQPPRWRKYALFEYFRKQGGDEDDEAGERSLTVMPEDLDAAWDYDYDYFSVRPNRLGALPPAYQGVRSQDYLYVQYPKTGEREFYDLASDPYMLCNMLGDATDADCVALGSPQPWPPLIVRLSRIADVLSKCKGEVCRVNDGRK